MKRILKIKELKKEDFLSCITIQTVKGIKEKEEGRQQQQHKTEIDRKIKRKKCQ